MTVHYIHHSCFAVETETLLLVFDYWKDSADGRLRQLLDCRGDRALYFIVSHFHEDHYNPVILDVADARWLLSYDTVKRRRVPKEKVDAILRPDDVYQDENLTLYAMRSTDVGVSSLVTLTDGTTLYHAGDNNNWYFPEDPGEHIHCSLKEMEGLFLASVRSVAQRTPEVEHVMFPVDPRLGSEMTRGAFQWLWHVKTRHFYPMHCWDRWEEVKSGIYQLQENFPEVMFHVGRD